MAFNGSGVFNRLYNWAQDKANAIKIRADRMDAEMDGFATGLSNVICRDGQSTVIADLPMNAHKLTGLSAGTSNGESVRYEQISERLAAEVEVASAATCNILGAASERVHISGTTTITSLGSGANKVRHVRFSDALTLTHDGTSLILPGAADITTAAGDTAIVVSDASSNARVVHYQRAAAQPYSAGMVLLTSGTVSNAATLDIDLSGYTAYRGFKVVLGGWRPANDAVNLHIRFSTDGGQNFDSGASDYAWGMLIVNDAANGSLEDNADSTIHVSEAIGSAATESLDLDVNLINPFSSAFHTKVRFDGVGLTGTGNATRVAGGGKRAASQETDAIRFLFSSGNIAEGDYAVYGLL